MQKPGKSVFWLSSVVGPGDNSGIRSRCLVEHVKIIETRRHLMLSLGVQFYSSVCQDRRYILYSYEGTFETKFFFAIARTKMNHFWKILLILEEQHLNEIKSHERCGFNKDNMHKTGWVWHRTSA